MIPTNSKTDVLTLNKRVMAFKSSVRTSCFGKLHRGFSSRVLLSHPSNRTKHCATPYGEQIGSAGLFSRDMAFPATIKVEVYPEVGLAG
jgi:hypothetical protein